MRIETRIAGATFEDAPEARPGSGISEAPDRKLGLRAQGWIAAAAFLLVAVAGILLRPLTPIDETRYVAVAWEMWQSGDYLVPTKNFELYTHKPPLLFWSINLIWALTGVSEFAARMIGPLYAFTTVLMTGVLARRLWPEDAEIGSRAVMALAGMLSFAILGGLTMFDAMLALATVSGLLALVNAVRTGARRWWAMLGVAIAVGVVAKGPVILLHLVPAILLARFWVDKAAISPRQVAAGAALALGVALATVGLWLIPAVISGGPEYRHAILWTQSAGRVTQSFAHARPWWFLLALLPLLAFPWILVPRLWRAAWRMGRGDEGLRLCAVWAGTALILFSLISGKQAHYLMPELPAVALIVARLSGADMTFRLTWAVVPVGLAAVLVLGIVAGLLDPGVEARDLLHPMTAVLAGSLLLASLCLITLRMRGLQAGVVLSIGIVACVNLTIGMTETGAAFDTHPIASAIAPFEGDGIAIVGQDYHAEFNFAGRLREAVAIPETDADLANWISDHPRGVIVGQPDKAALPWAPRRLIGFRTGTYAIWYNADMPPPPA